ncbi:hypothetical protein BD779DRAFT_1573211 [Infundibulicybe gibba]|nr:hypothetical protein BD779DRAFT_1587240 [Infundibulicybe gibba]KAF8872342.1 hypothetical protein BD779DRAFT_1573211 [Infundibulicybe gibba]
MIIAPVQARLRKQCGVWKCMANMLQGEGRESFVGTYCAFQGLHRLQSYSGRQLRCRRSSLWLRMWMGMSRMF